MPIRVILADDHPIVRTGIRNLLSKTEDIVIIGETGTGADAIRLVNELNPDVLLLDMEMPGLEGVDVARRLHSSKSSVRILALSAYDDRQYIQELLEQGASGYLTKDEAPDTIVDAVRGVARGEQGWLSRKIAAKMSIWIRDDDQDPRKLTMREIEVLRLLTEGKTNQGIGAALGISEKTVEKYLDSMFKKLGVNSRVDAAVRAVREGII
ncbi:MAG TPA: response regulator transcription factor [Anaerolineaceae bacterium]|nr:response regulator transcription factor [Anaerolineaceae bacterium]